MKVTVHQGLAEMKKLQQRIDRVMEDNDYIGIIKGKQKDAVVLNSSLTVDKFNKNAKAALNSVMDLINRRDAIKRAIVLSNATTYVQVGKKKMTVAEAIELKSSINNKIALLEILENQYRTTTSRIDQYNEKLESNMTNILECMGKDSSKEFIENYKNANGYFIVDPLDLKTVMDNLNEEIEDFTSNVDIALSVSNAITLIEIE